MLRFFHATRSLLHHGAFYLHDHHRMVAQNWPIYTHSSLCHHYYSTSVVVTCYLATWLCDVMTLACLQPSLLVASSIAIYVTFDSTNCYPWSISLFKKPPFYKLATCWSVSFWCQEANGSHDPNNTHVICNIQGYEVYHVPHFLGWSQNSYTW